MVETVQTPNGKTFVLENLKSDTGEWYLDHRKNSEGRGRAKSLLSERNSTNSLMTPWTTYPEPCGAKPR
jgi:hypothetical protein